MPFKPLCDKIWPMNPNVEKISKVIKNLEHLERCAKYYREHWPTGEINHLGLNTGADNYWSQNAQTLIEKIDLDFEEIWGYLAVHTKREDNFGGYFTPVGTVTQNLTKDIGYVINKSRNPDDIHKLIQHLKKIQRRLEVKLRQNQEQAEAEQNIAPVKWRMMWTCVKRIPRWIYVLVLFFAALLTCIYLLWWLWTKFLE